MEKLQFPNLECGSNVAASGCSARDFAIRQKVSGRSLKQFLFWDLRSKKVIGSGCNPGGCGLQGEACELQSEVEYLKVQLEILNT
jgi:hypothetical protein